MLDTHHPKRMGVWTPAASRAPAWSERNKQSFVESNYHIESISAKAKKMLGFLKRNCSKDVPETPSKFCTWF